ncbi:MAG TPA: class I SAM-dependent methyltransferase [Methylophilaceae bacterium]|nr:class I SAM-dependent methyltransferase [Methylophilaceae bacterium]
MLPTHHQEQTPSAWVCRHAGLIRPGGRVLDVAAGSGRNTCWLAGLGLQVEAVDRDEAALHSMLGIANIQTRVADLENSAWPYAGEKFDAIVVCRYLYRPLLPLLAQCLAPQGVLIYETFMLGHEAYGRPQNPDFLLKPNELLEVFMPVLKPVAFEQGLIREPQAAVIQRICAVENTAEPVIL